MGRARRIDNASGENGTRNLSEEDQKHQASSRSVTGMRTGDRFRQDTLVDIGAGEGIRTLDPDLGKVVLYP